MRYVIFGLAILLGIFVVTIATSHLPREATASGDDTNDTVFELEHTIDAERLPRQEIPDEVYR